MTRALQWNKIADTGLMVTSLGLGSATLAGIFSSVPAQQARATVDAGYDLGIRYFDTAPQYGFGRAERVVGDQVRGKEYVLSSKAGRLLVPGASDPQQWVDPLPFTVQYDYSYDGILRSFEASLHRLGLDRIDILYMHDIGNATHGPEDGPEQFRIAMSEGYKAMDVLRSEGRIKAIGLGVNEAQVCMDALDHGNWDAFLLAGRYTLLEQSPLDDLFPKCAAHGTDIVIGGPFNSGILVGGSTFDYENAPTDVIGRAKQLATLCQDHGVELPAAALKFCDAHPIVKSTIPGPRSPEEAKQIHNWWLTDIPDVFWSDLNSSGYIHADAPLPVSTANGG